MSICGIAARRRILAYYAPATLDPDVFLAPDCICGECDFKLDRGANIQRGIGANVDAGGAEVPGYSTGIAR